MALTTSGLVAYYNSKQGISGATWSNIAPGATGLHLTLTGSPDTSAAATTGVLFDAVDDRAESTDSFTSAAQFTLEAWIQQTVAGTSGIFGFYSSDTVRGYIGTNSSSDYYTYVDQAGSNRATTGTVTKPSTNMNLLTHFIMRYNGTAIENWINGVQLGTSGVAPSALQGIATLASRKLAAGPSNYFKGYILVARAYNRALTNTEIADNYAFGTAVGLSGGSAVSGDASVTGVSTFTATGSVAVAPQIGNAALTGVASLTASGTVANGLTWLGDASLVSVASISAGGRITYNGNASLAGVSTMSALAGGMPVSGNAALTSVSSMAATGGSGSVIISTIHATAVHSTSIGIATTFGQKVTARGGV